MNIDVMGLIGACSYALDCVEAELTQVTTLHSKRVAYMSIRMARQMNTPQDALQDLAVCALLHDNALTQYIREELNGDITSTTSVSGKPLIGIHCTMGEDNLQRLPFLTDVRDVIRYHHENADGSGPFGKIWQEVPLFARIIHLCDLLDVYCRAKTFTPETYQRADRFLSDHTGTLFDRACVDAFRSAFPESEFVTLGEDDLETRLWQEVPRIRQDLDFAQIKALADFFARIVDYKSPFTSTHSIGVATDAELLARYMGFDEDTAQKMYLAGALHDIGKVAIGNEILEKPDRLTDDEFAVMKHHAAYTYSILSNIEDFEEIRDWAAFHHERLDGTGYPFKKTAAELNTQERIMACVDIYQALTESRPYKKGMPHEKASSILRDMAERGWLDGDIVAQVDQCFVNL